MESGVVGSRTFSECWELAVLSRVVDKNSVAEDVDWVYETGGVKSVVNCDGTEDGGFKKVSVVKMSLFTFG